MKNPQANTVLGAVIISAVTAFIVGTLQNAREERLYRHAAGESNYERGYPTRRRRKH
jgi:hypothetical protein